MSDLEILGGGEGAFRAILAQIESAQSRIEIHAFLWHDDDIGNKLGAAVLAAAERGVEVFIHKDRVAAVYELFGGNKQSFFHKQPGPVERFQAKVLSMSYARDPKRLKLRPTIRRRRRHQQRQNPLVNELLAHPNISVRWSDKRFDHSKVFIFDNRVLVLGSMGIGNDHHDDWIDMMVQVTGAEHVARLRQRMAGECVFDPERHIDFLVHNQKAHAKKTCPMLNERLTLIDSASHTLVIEMAYLGDRRFTNAMVNAVNRGVDVTLVTGRTANVLQSLGMATCSELLTRTGAPDNLTIALHPQMVHAKLVVVDQRFSDVGSANFTRLSHGVYDEVNMYVRDEDFAQELTAHAMMHLEECEIVRGRLLYKKLVSQIERATVAYQARNGA